MTGTCAQCGKAFRKRRSVNRFCSRACVAESSKRQVERECPVCGTTFSTCRSHDHECCSKSCAMRKRASGKSNPRYNGGLCFYRGRWLICCRDGSIVAFARGVMAAEIGRLLESEEIVHHVNGDPADDRIENLQVVSRSEHVEIHREEFEVKRRERSNAARARRAVVA